MLAIRRAGGYGCVETLGRVQWPYGELRGVKTRGVGWPYNGCCGEVDTRGMQWP